MHEMGIIDSMLQTVEAVIEEQQLTKIDKIVIQVGEISGIIPRFVEECYPMVVNHTKFEDTELEVEVIPGIVRCNQCQTEFNAMKCDFKCPNCGARDMEPLSGRDFFIKEIVAC